MRGRERERESHCHSDRLWNSFKIKGNAGKLPKDRVECIAIMGFPERLDREMGDRWGVEGGGEGGNRGEMRWGGWDIEHSVL